MKVWDDPYTEQLPCLEVQDEDGDTEVLPLEEFPVATLEGCPTENVTLDSVEAIRYPDMASEKLPQSQTASHAQHLQARQGKSTEKPTEYGTKSPADVSLRIALPVDREETAVLRKQLGKAKRNMRIYYTKVTHLQLSHHEAAEMPNKTCRGFIAPAWIRTRLPDIHKHLLLCR